MASKVCYYLNQTRQVVLAREARLCDGFFARLKGLLGTTSLERGFGIYIVPCNQIHMFGMKYAIDCVFIDKNGTVVGLVQSIGPGAMSPMFHKAHGCLELPAGTIADTGTALGDTIESGSGVYTGGVNPKNSNV